MIIMPRGGITALCLKSVWLKFQRHPTNNENFSPGHYESSRDFDSYRGPSRASGLGAHLPRNGRILGEIHRAKPIGNHWGFGTFLD